ncbi:carbohydrate ABC transporter permease [Paenibacillus koleovorans]|uniref:carbohydrate ABC transporter permease n=1 Tax=Paenibacillus koleovorans TaxID=121608 RepID=UPI000FD9E031|nr:carbohydrate ABC transporter permease [Paenibacillus koleovorans]
MVNRPTWAGRAFDIANYAFLTLFAVCVIIPFLYIIAGSFAAPEEFARKTFVLFPTNWSLAGYRYIFSTDTIRTSLLVTVGVTVVGTIVNLFLTALMGYGLSRQGVPGRGAILFLVLFSMLFSGGIIPTFLVVKLAGLLNSVWALIVPGAISAFNLIILKNFFQQLPEGLEEAAKMDGCNDFGILFRIVLPLSAPAIATFALFYAVGHWNSFFTAILYINDAKWWPIQVWLRQIVILSQGGIGDSSQGNGLYTAPPGEIIKMAVIVVSTVPMLLVYPFLQRHFTKGILLGSVKG